MTIARRLELTRQLSRRHFITSAALLGLLPLAAEAETYTFDAESLHIVNLIGEIEIIGHDGDRFEVETELRGEDADELKVESETGNHALFAVQFPVEDERRYVYPRLGRGSKTTFSLSDHDQNGSSGWLSNIFGRLTEGQIKVEGRGSGLEAWADLVIRVPNGGRVKMDHGVGTIVAENVVGDMILKTRSGAIGVDTHEGDLSVDTGSGDITLLDTRGELAADTGSGHVEIEKAKGPIVSIDTGSGHVRIAHIECKELKVDTGSGRVSATDVSTDDANIDTGSGSVTLEFARMGDGDFIIDTGSGAIDILLPDDASADIVAETGSGSIRLDVRKAEVHHRERDEMDLSIGNGDARVRLETGSGGILIAQR